MSRLKTTKEDRDAWRVGLPSVKCKDGDEWDGGVCFTVDSLLDLMHDADLAAELDDQIDRLAKFITGEIPGEPSQSQGAVDTAIRIMRDLRSRLAAAEQANAKLREALALIASWEEGAGNSAREARAALQDADATPSDGRTHYEGCEKIHPDCAPTRPATPSATRPPEGFDQWLREWKKETFHPAFQITADYGYGIHRMTHDAWLAATERAARVAEDTGIDICNRECSHATVSPICPSDSACQIGAEIAGAIRTADAPPKAKEPPTATTEKGKA